MNNIYIPYTNIIFKCSKTKAETKKKTPTICISNWVSINIQYLFGLTCVCVYKPHIMPYLYEQLCFTRGKAHTLCLMNDASQTEANLLIDGASYSFISVHSKQLSMQNIVITYRVRSCELSSCTFNIANSWKKADPSTLWQLVLVF